MPYVHTSAALTDKHTFLLMAGGQNRPLAQGASVYTGSCAQALDMGFGTAGRIAA